MLNQKILFVPGLNLNPNQMESFASKVTSNYDIMILPGINPQNKKQKIQSFEEWVEALVLKIQSESFDSFVGFSLGGLLLATLIKRGHINPDQNKVTLLAPALRIFPHSWLPEKIFNLIKIPGMISLQKSQFIVHRVTPRGLYMGLYEGIRKIEDDLSFLNHQNIQCFLHERDELVWSKQISNELSDLNEQNIKLQTLKHKALLGPHLHHLCFHPDNLTNNDFEAFLGQMTQFLDT